MALCWFLFQFGLTSRRRRELVALPADRVYRFLLSVTTHAGKRGILRGCAHDGPYHGRRGFGHLIR